MIEILSYTRYYAVLIVCAFVIWMRLELRLKEYLCEQ